jgi:hypothetical protein
LIYPELLANGKLRGDNPGLGKINWGVIIPAK